MISIPIRGRASVVAAWLVTAVVLWLVAAAIDRRSVVVIESLGDHLRFEVDGTELVLPEAFDSATELTLWTADSIDPPGIIDWSVLDGGQVRRLDAPRRFRTTPGDPAPVGDWWVDDRLPVRPAARHTVDLGGSFEIRLRFRGRLARELSLTVTGDPTLHFGLRRGLKDNYLAIRDDTGEVVAATTIAPAPAADCGAVAAQILRGVSAAGLLIALVAAALALLPGAATQASKAAVDGDRRSRHRGLAVSALGLAAIAAGLSAWVAIGVLDGRPHQIDEAIYLLQGRWIADGDLAPAVSAIQEHLRVPFTYVVDGRWVGHYPVGWPAVLAAWLAAGIPHLVNPLLSAILVLLIYLAGRELDDEITGLAAAALAAASPLLRLLGGSLFPHTLCAVLVTTAVLFTLTAKRRPRWWLGAGVGMAMGICFAVRPLTAVTVSGALGLWMLVNAVSSKRTGSLGQILIPTVASGLLASLPTFFANHHLTGSPWAFPYSLAAGQMLDPALVPYGLANLDAILVTASATLTGWGWPLTGGALALALPIALVALPFLLRTGRSFDLMLVAVILAVALGHIFTRAHGLHGYGARYAVDAAPCFFLLAGRGLRELWRFARSSMPIRTAVAGVVIVFSLWTVVTLPARLGPFRGYYGLSGQLERQLARTGCERALILLPAEGWLPWAEAGRLMTGPRRLAIVFGADIGDNSVIEKAHPDRPLFYWDGKNLHREDRGIN